MLSNDTLKRVKKQQDHRVDTMLVVKFKIYIIMQIKVVILSDNRKLRKIFSNIWGHSGGWLMFSGLHGVAY